MPSETDTCRLSSIRIAEWFGPSDDSPAAPTIRALYRALEDDSPLVERRIESWRTTFAEGFGEDALEEATDNDALTSQYGVDADDPTLLLFCVHTYFALVVKHLTDRLVADSASYDDVANIRRRCKRLEDSSHWENRGIEGFLEADIFDWYLEVLSDSLADAVDGLFHQLDPDLAAVDTTGPTDYFTALYQSLVPPEVRHGLGEYYTPRWLAETTLKTVGYDGSPDLRILDPTCGSGTFLVEALRRARQWWADHGDDSELSRRQFADELCDNVTGFDLNPLAVLAARANVLLGLDDFVGELSDIELSIHCRDALPARGTVDLFESRPSAPETGDVGDFDFVVGNPPWVNWQRLSSSMRQRTKPLWNHYGLFSLSGTEGRHGGGKKDLSMLMVYACCDEYLADGGRLGMLITRSVFKSKGAGDGFRRFRYESDGETIYLRPREVHDFTDLQPFEGATTETALICLQRSRDPFDYPVDYRVWTGDASTDLTRVERAARPVDPDDETSPWLTAPPDALTGIAKVVGASDYTAYEGVNSGGLNACYWVRELEQLDGDRTRIENLADVGRIDVDRVRTTVERERLFPLLRSGDLERWSAAPECSIILAQDPETRRGLPEAEMRERFPETYDYFQQFEGEVDDPSRGTLRGRSLFRRYFEPTDPFYSMYGVGPYTIADWKVCWTRIDTRLRAAVVGPDDRDRPVLPQETITFVSFDDPDEAHYFCAMFNSAPADSLVRNYSSGKGFASAHILDTVGIPAFDDSDLHRRLVELSRGCHEVASRDDEIDELETAIDEAAARIWGIETNELEAVVEALDKD